MTVLLMAIGLSVIMMVPAFASATVHHDSWVQINENDWGNKCLNNQTVTVTTVTEYRFIRAVDDGANFKGAHTNIHAKLVEGTDSLGWIVTKYQLNQVHDSYVFGNGEQNLYNLHMTVMDPDPNSKRAYTANFQVLLKRDWPEPAFELVNNGQGECIRWNN